LQPRYLHWPFSPLFLYIFCFCLSLFISLQPTEVCWAVVAMKGINSFSGHLIEFMYSFLVLKDTLIIEVQVLFLKMQFHPLAINPYFIPSWKNSAFHLQ
jgi:hypothetical protein